MRRIILTWRMLEFSKAEQWWKQLPENIGNVLMFLLLPFLPGFWSCFSLSSNSKASTCSLLLSTQWSKLVHWQSCTSVMVDQALNLNSTALLTPKQWWTSWSHAQTEEEMPPSLNFFKLCCQSTTVYISIKQADFPSLYIHYIFFCLGSHSCSPCYIPNNRPWCSEWHLY